MKRIIVFAVLIFCGLVVFSACDTQHKCAAYGHYSYYQTPMESAE